MSFQAVTWSIAQTAGGPSAKATLWSIANYANQHWCAWPSQKTICEESEQSPDAIQKRLPELEARGLIRRIPMRFAGRKTVDFVILQPSPLFEASLPEIEPYIPRGFTIDPKYVAADCGNDICRESPVQRPVPDESVAADCGSVASGESVPALPLALPQIAAHVAALERQLEPNITGDGGGERARASPISEQAFEVTDRIAEIAGFPDRTAWPVGWCGAPTRVQAMLDHGWQPAVMIEAARAVMARKRDGPPETIRYFEKPFARAHAQAQVPLPTASEVRHEAARSLPSGPRSGPSLAAIAVARARAAGGA